jgi:hypothetical protein
MSTLVDGFPAGLVGEHVCHRRTGTTYAIGQRIHQDGFHPERTYAAIKLRDNYVVYQ